MQILKVEIGGDTNSTSGAEPSHEHTRGSVNCNRGYEWWLMEQAKARNPNITLVGLSWGAPGWIGNGTFFTNDAIDYLVAWLDCATSHGLTINYLGGWNEKGFNATWYKNLRSALNSRGFGAVKLVAADDFGWGDADEALRDPAFGSRRVGLRQPLRLRVPQRAEQLPELRQRGGHRQAAVGQRERVGRLQRRRPGAGARHQPRLPRREDDRRTSTGRSSPPSPPTSPGPPRAWRWRRSPGRASTRSAGAPG